MQNADCTSYEPKGDDLCSLNREPTQSEKTSLPSKKGKIYRGLLKTSGQYLYPTVTLVNLGLGLFNVFVLLILAIAFARIAYKPVPNLVELQDGSVVQTTLLPDLTRNPDSIKAFVAKVTSGLFSWRGSFPVEGEYGQIREQIDSGVELAQTEKQRVPTTVWQISFALSQDFRLSFLSKLAQTIPEGIYSNRLQAVFEFKHIGQPEFIGEGKWEVPVIGNIVFYSNGTAQQDLISFNKIFVVQAIDTPPPLLQENASPVEKISFEIRSYQLEVTEIKEYREKD